MSPVPEARATCRATWPVAVLIFPPVPSTRSPPGCCWPGRYARTGPQEQVPRAAGSTATGETLALDPVGADAPQLATPSRSRHLVVPKQVGELGTGADAELAIHPTEMHLNGFHAEKQLG